MPPEKTRTTHVRRITNADNPDIWIDVERVDKLPSTQGQGPSFKKFTRKMFWADESDDASHPTRGMTETRIEDPTNEENFVNLNVIDRVKTQRGQGPGYLKSTKKYRNKRETNTARQVTIRRVYHWDTNGDPNDTGGTNYERIEGTKDEEQYIDVAVIERLIATQGQGPGFKRRTFKFNTDPIKEFSEPAPADVDLSKVVYLDPWQNIINVKWEEEDPYLVLQFAYRAGPRDGDILGDFIGSGVAPFRPDDPANSTRLTSLMLRTSVFVGFMDTADPENGFELSGFPEEEELIPAPGNFPGSYEAYSPTLLLTGGPHEFISRHTYTPGSPLTDEEDAAQVAPFVGNPPYTDSLSIEYTMFTDTLISGPFVHWRAVDGMPPNTPGILVYTASSGQLDEFSTRSWDFTGASFVYQEKTYRAIGAAFQDRVSVPTDRRNGPLFILFKHDPESD